MEKNFPPNIVLLRVSCKNYLFKGTDDDAKSMIVNIYDLVLFLKKAQEV